MKPIRLTAMRGGTFSEAHDEPVYVNPELIREFGCYGKGDTRTYVAFNVATEHLWVRESPEEVGDMIYRNRVGRDAELAETGS
jgi:hypothetical protein